MIHAAALSIVYFSGSQPFFTPVTLGSPFPQIVPFIVTKCL